MRSRVRMWSFLFLSMTWLIFSESSKVNAESTSSVATSSPAKTCEELCKRLEKVNKWKFFSSDELSKLAVCDGLDDTRKETVSALASIRKEKDEQDELVRKFAGIKFGVGLSLTIDVGDNDRVQDAELVGDPDASPTHPSGQGKKGQ